ncbi:MAG: DUF3160 domain-containing protein [Deltaproteobacteria bacterium]|nr:DUF3160 domain-containing protein [Deltaproteobacteria bacterium]
MGRLFLIAQSVLIVAFSCVSTHTGNPFEKVKARSSTEYLKGEISDPRKPFSESAETAVDVNPRVPGYELPLDLSLIVNLDRDVREKGIDPIQGQTAEKLSQNGFVIVPTGPGQSFRRFADAYEKLSSSYDMSSEDRIPVFVTSDSVLHLYHLFFDQILKYLEASEFRDELSTLLSELLRSSFAQYQGFDEPLKEAARRNLAFLSIALKLLDPDASVPNDIPEIKQELALIDDHKALKPSPLMNYDCPEGCDPCGISPADVACQARGACTCEDYTQYIPRGHYTLSEELERYFKAMMWLGRIGFRMRSDMETIQSVLITDALNAAEVDSVSAAEIWHRIYDVTGFLVGAADDLTFFEYQAAVNNAFGNRFDMARLASSSDLDRLKSELDKLREPKIPSGFVSAFLDETEYTKGFRMMGQRFAPDSYVLGQLVWDHIGPNLSDDAIAPILQACGAPDATCEQVVSDLALSNCICASAPERCRFMPKGLDVMAVLGSEPASTYLEPDNEYCGFEQTLEDLKDEFAAYDRRDWRQNVYWYWLDVLTPLHQELAEGYPNWMRTTAWATKELNTQLTSWAELRHDTILYVKQSYTRQVMTSAFGTRLPEMYGTVEPVPEFFARLRDLAAYTRDGLKSRQALPEGLAPHMDKMIALFRDLTDIAVNELHGVELSQPQIDTIKSMGSTFKSIVDGLAAAVTEEKIDPWCEHPGERCGEESELAGDDPYKTTIAADVHTDPNTKRVLEEGSGYLDWIIVARELPDGTVGVSVGPVFSYYEFTQPMSQRLTDDAWQEKLDNDPPPRPDWINAIRSE